MTAFLLALVAVTITTLGGRDQRLLAQLSVRLGQSAPLILAAAVTSVAAAIAMAWAGLSIAGMLPPAAKTMLIALALLVAAVEMAWPVRMRPPREPTRSLFAIGSVLLVRQIGDAARFLIFALAAGYAYPWLAAAGGALGGVIGCTIGWAMGDRLEQILPLSMARKALATVLGASAIVIAFSARGVL